MRALLVAAAAVAFAPPQQLELGTLRPSLCRHEPLTYCGTLERALDPTGALTDRIGVYFEFYPHTAPGSATGTLVATEGGPGYPATESRADYLALFAPLRAHHDVLIMDNRGTGRSGALHCSALQAADHWTVAEVGRCGAALGARAPLYSTAYAADDLAALLEALHRTRIDLYGDSYGTYFEQVFAQRHPGLLHSIVLDGAYPVDGPDYAWYPSYAPAARQKFDIACARSPACARVPGSGSEHLVPLLAALRRAPYAAHAPDADGVERRFTVDATALATVMLAGSPALASVRELDAASRAFLEGDRRPLERLVAETSSGVDSRDPSADPRHWSAGLETAVMCQDAPQIYDMRLAPAERAAARDRAIAERERSAPDTYTPFTIDEYRRMPLDYSFLDLCVAWPSPPSTHPPGITSSPYPDVAALVISGELDDMTTVADGAAVAHAFPHGRQIVIANSFHVNALPRARSECAADLVRRFLATGDTGPEGCAGGVSPLRLVATFPLTAQTLEPAEARAGNAANPSELKVVAAAVLTLGDVLTRLASNASGHAPGLRGGSFEITTGASGRHLVLNAVRFTNDVAVSGTLDARGVRDSQIDARLHVEARDPEGARLSGTLRVSWTEANAPIAHISGTLGSRAVRAEMAAP